MEHLHGPERLAAGIHALPGVSSAFASTQAAWRFFRNPRTTPSLLAEPLQEAARTACPPGETALILHDWSCLNYDRRSRKRDLVQITHKDDVGYFLSTALLVETTQGMPVAPVDMSLQTSRQVESTRTPHPSRRDSHLDAVGDTMDALAALLPGRSLVHVIDREADSVAHYRDWQRRGHVFLVRADHARRVRWEGEALLLPQLVARLRGAFRSAGYIDHRGRRAKREIAETVIVLDRKAKPTPRTVRRRAHTSLSHEPLSLRLIVSRLRDGRGRLLAEWLLLTNLPSSVPAGTVATWYAWRWRIEDVFRLLKSSGQQVEQWQQETGLSLLKRLLVASMACVLAWRLQREKSVEAKEMRRALTRLSGRQLRRGQDSTVPSLLAGLHVLLPFLALLEGQGAEGLLFLLASVGSVLRPLRESG